MAHPLTVHLTPEELKTRRDGIDYAIATNRLEGINYTQEELAVMERYASGEISREEWCQIWGIDPE